MTRSRSQLLTIAGRLAALAGSIGIAAGVAQAAIGSLIPDWSGNKDHPFALGLLTVALSTTVLVAARTLRAAPMPRDGVISAITVWLAVVAAVCSTTVGRLWAIPGLLLLAAAGVTLAACGWHHFRTVVATNWLRGLLGVLGALELLMAVSAAPAIIVIAGVVAGGALIAAAVLAGPGRKMIVIGLVATTLPFAALTWWTIVTPLLTVVAFVIGLVATRDNVIRSDEGSAAPLEPEFDRDTEARPPGREPQPASSAERIELASDAPRNLPQCGVGTVSSTGIRPAIKSEPHVSSIVDTVMMRSHGRWDRRLVLSLVNDFIRAFDGAPVQQFVEVLVVKEVTHELRRIDALRPIPS